MGKLALILMCSLILAGGSEPWRGTYGNSCRCPSGRIVKIGMNIHTVHRLCGEPTYKSEKELTSKGKWVQDPGFYAGLAPGHYTVRTKVVSVWTYVFDGNKFPLELTFEGGRLKRIALQPK